MASTELAVTRSVHVATDPSVTQLPDLAPAMLASLERLVMTHAHMGSTGVVVRLHALVIQRECGHVTTLTGSVFAWSIGLDDSAKSKVGDFRTNTIS